MTTDDMKLARDGHLEYGKVPSSKHAWVVDVCPVVKVTPTEVWRSDGRGGIIVYNRFPLGDQ